MSKPYQGTKVTVASSMESIRSLIKRYSGERVVVGETWDRHLAVEWVRERVQYRVQIPTSEDEKEERRLWRVLYWAIKSKSEAVASGLDSYEIAFMGAMVDPATRRTLSEIIVPMVEAGSFDADGGSGLRALMPGADDAN